MGNIFMSTYKTFTNEVIAINLDPNYMQFNNTFPAVSLCLVKGKLTTPLQALLNEMFTADNNNQIKSLMKHVKIADILIYHNPLQKSFVDFNHCLTQNKTCGMNLEMIKEKLLVKECDEIIVNVMYQGKTYSCKELFVKYHTEMGMCFIANSLHSV